MLLYRPRRNRKNQAIRDLVQENRLSPKDFISPVFISEFRDCPLPNANMPGVFIHNLDSLLNEIEQVLKLSIPAVALFPVIANEQKDENASVAFNEKSLMCKAIRLIKENFPEVCLIGDIALDPYTIHGHDGIINKQGDVDNDLTIKKLAELSLLFAGAGIDILAPSDMMDGRVAAIRFALDNQNFHEINILSYAAKYASCFYGPYRNTLKSHLQFGSKKTYQMNPANQKEALLEALLDEKEGADMLMVKPALPYLDIIAKIKEKTHLPIAAYHVSGEYAMVVAAEKQGWIKASDAFIESFLCLKRAGADMIVSYAAKQVAALFEHI